MRDFHVYGGALLASIGLYLVHQPAALIFGGLFLLWFGIYWVKDTRE